MFTNSLLFAARDVFFLSVLWYDFMNEKIFPFFCKCNNHKTLCYLELNFKRRLTVVDVGFENWGISLERYIGYTPGLAGEYSVI